jgi:hypothetical protein
LQILHPSLPAPPVNNIRIITIYSFVDIHGLVSGVRAALSVDYRLSRTDTVQSIHCDRNGQGWSGSE